MQDSNMTTPPPQTPNSSNANFSDTSTNQENGTFDGVVERIKQGDNILVALSKNPSVDELVAAIAITLYLDKYGKHATAIFSGKIPNAIKFLKPEDTLADNTDSLQDFIIALNKEKADHLRYKLEGDFVRVYISPYKTKISKDDLEFSYGDFNVDLAIAINIADRHDLDNALTEYGRITHDATSINILNGPAQNFGEVEWCDPSASSVSEMFYRLIERLDENEDLLDSTIANALLTGIVASTQYFSNSKTTSRAMGVAANLMSAGADQQLIAASINTPGYQAPNKKEEKGHRDNKHDAEAEKENVSEPIITIPKSESHKKEKHHDQQTESKKDDIENKIEDPSPVLPDLPSFDFAEPSSNENEKEADDVISHDTTTDFSQVDKPALPPNPFMTAEKNTNEDKEEKANNDDITFTADNKAENTLGSISNNEFTPSEPVSAPKETTPISGQNINSSKNDAFNFEAPVLPEKETAIQESGMKQLDAAISTPTQSPLNETSSIQEALESPTFTDVATQDNNAIRSDNNLNDTSMSGLDAFFPPPPPPPSPIAPTTMSGAQLPNVNSSVDQKDNLGKLNLDDPKQPASAEPPSISSFQIPDTGENESIFSDDDSK